MIILENWSIGFAEENPYTPPENRLVLVGEVYGHPEHPDGKIVRTSRIISVCKNIVNTAHNEYTLGQPSKDYVQWCKANGAHIPTEEEPIKIHKFKDAVV